jgi:hypothetical protein
MDAKPKAITEHPRQLRPDSRARRAKSRQGNREERERRSLGNHLAYQRRESQAQRERRRLYYGTGERESAQSYGLKLTEKGSSERPGATSHDAAFPTHAPGSGWPEPM